MENATDDDLISTAEAAKLLALSPATLATRRVRPDPIRLPLPYVKIGKVVRYRRGDVLALIEAGRRLSTSDPGPSPTT